MALQIPSTTLNLRPVNGGSFTLRGRSRAGDGTTFVIQELRWMMDMGALVQNVIPDVVFLTHTHSDHITFMPQILMDEKKHTDAYLPAKALPFVTNYLKAHQELLACEEEVNSDEIDAASPHYTLHPLEFGDEFQLHHKGTTYTVTALQCHHRIDCLGFSIFRSVKKIKKEFSGLTGREIGNLRKQGVVIHDEVNTPFFCHLGDTTHVVFDTHPEILRHHKYIVVECSFFCDRTHEKARDTKHMHWKDLKPIVESHCDVLFILIHFSLRYSSLEIRRFFANATSTHNVHPMLLESELRSNYARGQLCDCFACEDHREWQKEKAERTSESPNGRHRENAQPRKRHHKRWDHKSNS